MKTYKAKQDIINGVLPNTNGQPNILFRKGDAIIGQQVERFIFNQNMKGILAKPTVPSARVENPDGLAFVPFSQIDIIVDNSPKYSSTSNGSAKTTSTFLTPQVKVGIGILGGVALLFIAIKFWK